ncbi:transmembrane protein 256 [Microcaecilia unicolor]|uniref:Transmembrane protein 256 n=1 Tax=Microcaecilia unicolor TaxID=1415580 RepID=A0A6P7WXZ3_9AMPH|nr:transmembrane protein 256 [Microcaecilia unicolor]
MAAIGSGRLFLRIGAVSGSLAVGAGAYGAHGQRIIEQEEYNKELYKTANRYHFLHSLALLAVPHCRKPLLAGSVMTSGMVMFCGALYYQALTGDPSYVRVAPTGGWLMILGWAAMAL